MGESPERSARLVLASASPRRAELLARLGITPVLRPVAIDETPQPREPATQLVTRLATAKAEASAALGTLDEVVLAADTVVLIDGRLLGKPRDRADARTMLATLSGRTHEVVTGVSAQRGAERRYVTVTTQVTFRSLRADEIDWYLTTGEPDDKAGAYGLQGAGAVMVDRIDGSDTNVIGLPLSATLALLRELGLDPLSPPDPGSRGDRRSPAS